MKSVWSTRVLSWTSRLYLVESELRYEASLRQRTQQQIVMKCYVASKEPWLVILRLWNPSYSLSTEYIRGEHRQSSPTSS